MGPPRRRRRHDRAVARHVVQGHRHHPRALRHHARHGTHARDRRFPRRRQKTQASRAGSRPAVHHHAHARTHHR